MPDQLVRVYDDTRGRGTCRGCGAPLVWFETVAGKRMPFDGEPVARKSEHDDSRRLVLFLSAEDTHFRSCPDAKTFRK